MAKLDLRLQFILGCLAASALTAACGDDSEEDDGAGGAVASGGTTNTGGGGFVPATGAMNGAGASPSTGGTSGSSEFETACGDFTKCADTMVLDDFTRGDMVDGQVLPDTFGNEGYWYAVSETPGVTFTPFDFGDGGIVDGGGLKVEVSGIMFNRQTDPNAFAVVGFTINQNGETPCMVDASHFDGLRIVGTLKNTQVQVQVPEVAPPEFGGTCESNCWNPPRSFQTDASGTIDIPWTEFRTATNKPLDPSRITKIEFHPENDEVGTFSVELDSIGFYGGTGVCKTMGMGGDKG